MSDASAATQSQASASNIGKCVKFFTIGHARDEERFKTNLKKHGVRTLVDVRLVPFSRASPWTGKHALAKRLHTIGAEYIWLEELGNPSVLRKIGGKRLASYTEKHNGKEPADFKNLMDTPMVQKSLAELERLMSSQGPICVMCAEETWVGSVDMGRCIPCQAGPRGSGGFCHRYWIAKEMVARGCDVRHILPSGRIEVHADPDPLSDARKILPPITGQSSACNKRSRHESAVVEPCHFKGNPAEGSFGETHAKGLKRFLRPLKRPPPSPVGSTIAKKGVATKQEDNVVYIDIT